jgi:hypothetical protein
MSRIRWIRHFCGGHPVLNLRQEQAAHLQQQPRLAADSPALLEEHRDVVELAQPRRPVRTFEAVEVQVEVVVLQGGVEDKGRALPQRGGGERDVAGDLVRLVSGQDPVRRGPPDFLPGFEQEGLVLGADARLAGLLEAALVLAVDVAFEDVPGDLGGHGFPLPMCLHPAFGVEERGVDLWGSRPGVWLSRSRPDG